MKNCCDYEDCEREGVIFCENHLRAFILECLAVVAAGAADGLWIDAEPNHEVN